MKKWEKINQFKVQSFGKAQDKSSKFKVEELINIILENRGIKTRKDRQEFLEPKLENVTVENVGIDKKELKKSVKRIEKAIKDKEQIVVYGDYDVDGVCATAILWEMLHNLNANVTPYIPHRVEEGYGLSKTGISNIQFQISNVKLIITVDNGIVANEAVKFAKEQGIDVDVKGLGSQVGTIFSESDIEKSSAPVYKFFYGIGGDTKAGRTESVKKIVGAYDLKKKNFIEAKDVVFIGQLPPREVLLGQLFGMIAAPISSLLYILKEKSKTPTP